MVKVYVILREVYTGLIEYVLWTLSKDDVQKHITSDMWCVEVLFNSTLEAEEYIKDMSSSETALTQIQFAQYQEKMREKWGIKFLIEY